MSAIAPPLYPPGVAYPWVKAPALWEEDKYWPKGAKRLFDFLMDLRNQSRDVGKWTTCELAEALGRSQSSIWRSLQWLERNGIVARWWKYGPRRICGRIIEVVINLKAAAAKAINPAQAEAKAKIKAKVEVTAAQMAANDEAQAKAKADELPIIDAEAEAEARPGDIWPGPSPRDRPRPSCPATIGPRPSGPRRRPIRPASSARPSGSDWRSKDSRNGPPHSSRPTRRPGPTRRRPPARNRA